MLALFSQVGQFIGVSLGVNLVNALILGVLGVPGFGLLLMLQWVLPLVFLPFQVSHLAVRSAGGFLLPSVPGLVMIRVEM